MRNRGSWLSSVGSILSSRGSVELRGGLFGGIFLSFGFLLFASPVFAQYSGGSGVADDPYLISDANDLVLLSNTEGDWDRHFVLINDIDLSGVAVNRIGDGYNNRFVGSFDGDGHVIRNLSMDFQKVRYVGLFGIVGKGGIIRNLGLEDSIVKGDDYVGGLVGNNVIGAIANCYSTGLVSGDNSVGGLLGSNTCGSVTNSYSTGLVSGDVYVGGLVGMNDCSGDQTKFPDSKITNCYSAASVIGDNCVGGLVGLNYARISNCYSTGTVTGNQSVGGLLGGQGQGIATGCYYLESAGADNGYGVALSENAMRKRSSFAGWDFVGEDNDRSNDTWVMIEGTTNPRLIFDKSLVYIPILGSDNDPKEGVIRISNPNKRELYWDIDEKSVPDWLEFSSVSGTSSYSYFDISISFDTGELAFGLYWYYFNIYDSDTMEVVNVAGALVDVVSPILYFGQDHLDFSAFKDGENPSEKVLTISNSGGDILEWSIEPNSVCPWISVEPNGGVLGANESEEISIGVDIEGLEKGMHECDLLFTAPLATNSPESVKIRLLTGIEDEIWVPFLHDTIQGGIDAAVDGDVVIVADGVWRGDGNRDIEFGGKAITVRSANGPANCIIDSEGSYSLTDKIEDMHRGFYFRYEEGPDSVLDGFTITGGDAGSGGGIRCFPDSNPLIKNCIIKGNKATIGGGVDGGGTGFELRDCVISDNISRSWNGGDGGGISRCGGLINNCVIENNMSYSNGGGLYECGGRITRCVIRNNKSNRGGGLSDCHGMIDNCLIVENITSINYRLALPEGGGLSNCDGEIINCTISNNFCQFRFGAAVRGCNGSITNCIIRGNRARDILASVDPTFSCYSGESVGLGNVHVEPEFVGGSYYLRPGSDCIDAGNNTSIVDLTELDGDGNERLVDGNGDGTARVDMGAYEFDSERKGIFVSFDEMVFGGGVGLENPASQVFSIGCYGGGSVAWQVDTGGCEWIEVSEVGGDLAAGEVTKLKVSVDLAELEAGEYRCELVILAEGAEGSGSKISVVLRVGEIVNVPGDWGTIQEAIDNSDKWSVIVVGPGVYKENINFNGKAVTVRSSNPYDWNVIKSTVIDGDHKGICVVFENDEGYDSVLEGFTVTGGMGDEEVQVDYYSGGSFSPVGGGIFCRNSSPVIRWCNVTNNGYSVDSENYVQAGGGITVCGRSEAVIDTCMVTENITETLAPGIFLAGWSFESSCKVLNCTVANNFCMKEISSDYLSSYPIDGFGSLATIKNTIVSGLSERSIRVADPSLVSNCCLKSLYSFKMQYPGEGYPFELNSGHGIVSDDPGFIRVVDVLAGTGEHGDYRLRGDSICINRGEEDFDVLMGVDIDGEPRILRGRLDIGADEVSLVGDFEFDDEVGMCDFAYLAERWLEGDCGISNRFCGGADMDGNGVVGLEDVVVLSEAWITGVLP